jgi:protein-disulfide isomerase
VLILAAAALVAAALGIGIGVAVAGGSSSSIGKVPARGSLTGKLVLPNAIVVHKLLAGTPQHGNLLGKASAPVTMVEYIDLQCPYCDEFELNVFPDLVSRFVNSGELKIEATPIAFIGPDSQRGRLAAIAAAKQNRMFDFMELLYANQKTENTGWLNEKMVARAAASIPGLNVPRLLAERKSKATAKIATAFDRSAAAAGVRQTPTIFVGRSGQSLRQVVLKSAGDESSVVAAINAAASR